MRSRAVPVASEVIVHYYTEVEMPAADVSRVLAEMADVIGSIGNAAYRKGEQLQAQIGPAKLLLAKTVMLEVGEVEARGDVSVFPIAWWATGASRLFPRMEGEIVVAPLTTDHSMISFQGNYQPPLGKLGELLDRSILGRVADSTVKEWIDSLSGAVVGRS